MEKPGHSLENKTCFRCGRKFASPINHKETYCSLGCARRAGENIAYPTGRSPKRLKAEKANSAYFLLSVSSVAAHDILRKLPIPSLPDRVENASRIDSKEFLQSPPSEPLLEMQKSNPVENCPFCNTPGIFRKAIRKLSYFHCELCDSLFICPTNSTIINLQ